jgi:hypothetical protein
MQVALLWLHGYTKRTVLIFFENLKLGIRERKPKGITSIKKSVRSSSESRSMDF